MGRTDKEGQGQDGQGRVRTCLGQDGQGSSQAGQTWDKDGLDVKKLDANSSGLSPGLDARMTNGTAQSEAILSRHFGL